MGTEIVPFLAVSLLWLTSLLMFISQNWRLSILALAGQYVGVFLLVWLSWPLEMAVVKLVAGWMSGAVLGTTRINIFREVGEESPLPVNRLFRFLASGLVLLAVFSLAPKVQEWVPNVTIEQVWGALLLIGMGLLHLSLSTQSFRVVLALLTILPGFEIIYAVVENSTLVAGMLAGVNLGLALVGAYLLVAPTMEEF
jgi:hypothetical protein